MSFVRRAAPTAAIPPRIKGPTISDKAVGSLRMVLVEMEGKHLIGWSYADEKSREERLTRARGFVEGFDQGRAHCLEGRL